MWDLSSRVEPDYQIAFVSQQGLNEATVNLIAEHLEPLLPDRDGDKKVTVQVNSYALNPADPYAYTTQMALSNHIMLDSSSVYIMEDLMADQQQYGTFYQTDGTIPSEDATEFDYAGTAPPLRISTLAATILSPNTAGLTQNRQRTTPVWRPCGRL